MGRQDQLMAFSDHQLIGSKDYKILLHERETEGYRGGEDEQCLQAVNVKIFTT